MKIIEPSYEIMTPLDGEAILKHIEKCGRVCYKSDDKITDGSAEQFVRNIIKRGHESVLEHFGFTVKFITDRAIANEIVRHRIASFSQESTRYCNYSKRGFGREITVIEPSTWTEKLEEGELWFKCMKYAEEMYIQMLRSGATAQDARSILPNCLKTELVVTTNLREWRHILRLRTSRAAHPDMRKIMIPLHTELKERVPVIFDDIEVK